MARPVKVNGPPGANVIGAVAVGGLTIAGDVIATVGAIALASTSHSRVALRRSAWPAVSTAVAFIVQRDSYGSVTS